MIITGLSVILFLLLVYKVKISNQDEVIEKNFMQKDTDFTITTMPFRTERIVYYVTVPNPTFGRDPDLSDKLLVEYIKKKEFDSHPIAIQVYYKDKKNKKMVAEILSKRFEVPYLESLYGENLLTELRYEHLKLYKFNHPSTINQLRKEVAKKLTPIMTA